MSNEMTYIAYMFWSVFHCCDKMSNVHNLRNGLFRFTVLEVSVRGPLALKQKHHVERCGRGKLSLHGSQEVRDVERTRQEGTRDGTGPRVMPHDPSKYTQKCALLIQVSLKPIKLILCNMASGSNEKY